MVASNPQRLPLFPLGQVVATPGALEALESAGQQPAVFLNRHVTGDWGDLTVSDKKLNDASMTDGTRILSSYKTTADETIWIITETDRSATPILLPSEY